MILLPYQRPQFSSFWKSEHGQQPSVLRVCPVRRRKGSQRQNCSSLVLNPGARVPFRCIRSICSPPCERDWHVSQALPDFSEAKTNSEKISSSFSTHKLVTYDEHYTVLLLLLHQIINWSGKLTDEWSLRQLEWWHPPPPPTNSQQSPLGAFLIMRLFACWWPVALVIAPKAQIKPHEQQCS